MIFGFGKGKPEGVGGIGAGLGLRLGAVRGDGLSSLRKSNTEDVRSIGTQRSIPVNINKEVALREVNCFGE